MNPSYPLITISQIKSVKNYIHKNMGESQKQKQGRFNSISKYVQRNFINSSLLHIKVESKMYVLNGQKERAVDKSEIVYMIDNDGFLLDSENRYILDHSNRQIKLST